MPEPSELLPKVSLQHFALVRRASLLAHLREVYAYDVIELRSDLGMSAEELGVHLPAWCEPYDENEEEVDDEWM